MYSDNNNDKLKKKIREKKQIFKKRGTSLTKTNHENDEKKMHSKHKLTKKKRNGIKQCMNSHTSHSNKHGQKKQSVRARTFSLHSIPVMINSKQKQPTESSGDGRYGEAVNGGPKRNETERKIKIRNKKTKQKCVCAKN